ncbi:beta-channel forming cytolysin [Bacillus pseudomycoides]|uniref:beta-channel forming cytolysin n=1 Tax=Bacillus pseudomycoides TaxID=64104 RepID=UPI0020D2868E|nr:beta-channel forming cytolysin [Bacillus pseudomycoides]
MHSLDSTYNAEANIKNSIKVSFIDDPNTDKKYAIVFTEGSNIASNFSRGTGTYSAQIFWPSAFKTGLEITSNDNAKFYKVSPKNEIESKTVSSTVSYNVGGSLEVKPEGPSSSVSAGASWSNTISYEQPNYKTFLTNNTDKKVDWNVEFNQFYNKGYGPYNRDSSGYYGNELFMSSRTDPLINAEDNFSSDSELPSLVRFGFQPSTMAIIIADKNATSTDLSVKHARERDVYTLSYEYLKGWIGSNSKTYKHPHDKFGTIDNYKIDRQNNKIIHQSSSLQTWN